MSNYLIRWYDAGEQYSDSPDEERAVASVSDLAVKGFKPRLYVEVETEIQVKARIVKRRKSPPAPAEEGKPPPVPKPVAGEVIPEKQLCPAPECTNQEPCPIHASVTDKSIRREWAKLKKAARG